MGIFLICIIVCFFGVLMFQHLKIADNPDGAIQISVTSEQTASPAPQPSDTIPPSSSPTMDTSIYNNILSPVETIIENDIASGFPGAVLMVSLDGQTIFQKAYGYLKVYDGMGALQTPIEMRQDTVFDLASLTKVYATTFSVMKLVDEGLLSVDDYVYKYLPEFDKKSYNEITIAQLLSHTAGFPSDVKFFRPDVKEGEDFYSTDRNKTISLLPAVLLDNLPGEKALYSDIGYMVLGTVIEKISGMRLDEYVNQNIYEPMALGSSISFNPLENGFEKENIACTERLGNTRDGLYPFPGVRTYTLQGEVHDEKTYYSMGGVSGSAGLFADAQAITSLNLMLLNGGELNSTQIFSSEIVSRFTSIYNDATYQLGFANAAKFSSLEGIVPEGTLCHTGWTGAFTIVDKKNKLSIVLLTNKRHTPFNGDDFEGSSFETGKYFSIVTSIYESLGIS